MCAASVTFWPAALQFNYRRTSTNGYSYSDDGYSYGHSPWPQIIISMRRSFFGRLICKFVYEVHLKCVSHSRSNHRMLQVRQMATLECALIKGAACNAPSPSLSLSAGCAERGKVQRPGQCVPSGVCVIFFDAAHAAKSSCCCCSDSSCCYGHIAVILQLLTELMPQGSQRNRRTFSMSCCLAHNLLDSRVRRGA